MFRVKHCSCSVDTLFNFQDVDEDTIREIIDDFAAKESCGFDGITLMQLKYLRETLLAPITLITRQVIHTGILLEQLKIAKVIPIYKKIDDTIIVMTCQYPYYQPFPKSLKR